MNESLPSRPSGGVSSWFAREPFETLRHEIDSLLSRFAGESLVSGSITPSLDLSETENAVEIRMDLPGMKAEEIDVRVDGNSVSISGEKKEEKEEKGRSYHRTERRSGRFSRTVSLPCAVDQETVSADYRDGVLSLSLQKTADARSRKVKVKS